MGYTKVDLLHLLEDLRDAYADSLEETVLTELVANALDSGAHTIRMVTDTGERLCVVIDDGTGMQRRELRRFHDIAASTKTRGEGIGFAGVGVKLALLLCEDVVTETRRASTHVASRWRLANRNHAPWDYIEPPGRVAAPGTAVAMRLTNALSPLLDTGLIESSVRRHFAAFFDPAFDAVLLEHYRRRVTFELNGRMLGQEPRAAGEVAPIEVRVGRKRKPSAVGWLVRSPMPLPELQRGVAVSTLGKVIRCGWDWLGVSPAAPDRISGLIEVPALAECLTLNKADFIRTGTRGATYLGYRKALQEAVARQLEAWGDAHDAGEQRHRRVARPVERDLERVLVQMADDFPLLAALVERKEGGQRRLPIGRPDADGRGAGFVTASLLGGAEAGPPRTGPDATPDSTLDAGSPPALDAASPAGRVSDPGAAASHPSSASLPSALGPRRPGRYGLSIQFEDRAGDPRLGWLVESTVWVNEAHPAYRRAAVSRSEGYHLALTVAMALAPLAVEAGHTMEFVSAFLEHWGESLHTGASSQRRLL
jgi:hypothetical protein